MVGAFWALINYNQKRGAHSAKSDPSGWIKRIRIIKKKASVFSIVSVLAFFESFISYFFLFWMMPVCVVIFIVAFCCAIYFYMTETPIEIIEYHLKTDTDGPQIIH